MSTLIVLFTAAALVQVIAWAAIGSCLRHEARPVDGPPESPRSVSVVVAVRNGAEDLPGLLEAMKEQRHHHFEMILVDDRSEDRTGAIVERAADADKRIRLIRSPFEGKKAAVATGISSASHGVVVLTDADCRPETEWLSEHAHQHDAAAECIVVGYGPYYARPGLLNRLVRFETMHTALLLISAVALGRPYMAVGRNLSYRKSTFQRIDGLESHRDLLSGDDDLFVQSAVAAGASVRFIENPRSFVYSEAPGTLRKWVRQKHRHLSASRRYTRASHFGLAAYHLSAMLCWAAPLILGWPGFACLLCRLVPGTLVTSSACAKLREPGLTVPFAALDLAFQMYLLIITPFAWITPPKRW